MLFICYNKCLWNFHRKSNTSSNEGESSQNVEEVIRKRRKKVVCENFEEFVPRVIGKKYTIQIIIIIIIFI